jgi:hypothetical protein
MREDPLHHTSLPLGATVLNFLLAQYGTVSDIEIAWILITATGLIFSIYNVFNAQKDFQGVKKLGLPADDPRTRVAIIARRSEVARAVIQSIFLTIGLMIATIPETPTPYLSLKLQIFRFIFTWGFIVCGLLIAIKSYWGFQLRREIIARNALARDQAKLDSRRPQIDGGES